MSTCESCMTKLFIYCGLFTIIHFNAYVIDSIAACILPIETSCNFYKMFNVPLLITFINIKVLFPSWKKLLVKIYSDQTGNNATCSSIKGKQ